MNAASGLARGASPFSRGAVLSVVLVGFAAFVAMLYFIGTGGSGDTGGSGPAHAYANGLNGYAALAELLENEGYEVELSRTREGLETTDLLILTPPPFTDADEFGEVLENRAYLGPTLVILPKWSAARPDGEVVGENADRVQDDWVELIGANPVRWTRQLPEPFAFELKLEELTDDEAPTWEGLGYSGELPTRTIVFAEPDAAHDPFITDAAGHILALNVVGEEGSDYYDNSHWTLFVVEPDLMNNFGLANPDRAAAALALVREAGYSDLEKVTFDLTQNGFGDSVNLLTLAFRPPFLAATLCLILALIIVGWRAFLRFGPVAVSGPEIAFGKRQLVSNGAGLIVRARRLGLLAEPYVALVERRLGHALGIAKPDAEAIDSALRQRLPDEEPFSSLADRLRIANKPSDILRAAQALNALTGKIAR